MGFVFPVSGGGAFSDQFRWPLSWDNGIDIFAREGTPVVAVASGIVTKVGTNNKGGNRLWLTTNQGNFYYAHLSGFAAKSGEKVKAGQVIGYVGRTGNAYKKGKGTPHLHLGWDKTSTNGVVWSNPFYLLSGATKTSGSFKGLPADAIASQDSADTVPNVAGQPDGGGDGGSSLSKSVGGVGGAVLGYLDDTIVGPLKRGIQSYVLVALGVVLVVVALRGPIVETALAAAKMKGAK